MASNFEIQGVSKYFLYSLLNYFEDTGNRKIKMLLSIFFALKTIFIKLYLTNIQRLSHGSEIIWKTVQNIEFYKVRFDVKLNGV